MTKNIKFKCWIAEEDKKFYGPGPNALLKQIHKQGSLSKAAAQMKLSYKKAWELVQRCNQHSKEPLVVLKKGGKHGGGAEVTLHGLNVIQEYEKLEKELAQLTERHKGLIDIL